MSKLPTTVYLGKKVLIVPDDITAKEAANLAVALNLALAGALTSQEDADEFVKTLDIERLFVSI